MRRVVHRLLVLVAAASVASACGKDAPTAPTAGTAATSQRQAPADAPGRVTGAERAASMPPAAVSYPLDGAPSGASTISFPPRNEPYDFRVQLEAKYRDSLRRSPVSSFVDIEGTVVWTQEYLRYRLNGCLHAEAVDRVLAQIDGRGIQPVCGAETPSFPPRDQPFDFRVRLEAKYRDGLHREASATYVDTEGDIVWTQEYLRYRVSGCSHIVAVDKVFMQIDGRGVQPDCASPSGSGRTSYGRYEGFVAAFDYEGVVWTPLLTGTAAILLTWSDPSVDLDLYLTPANCTGYPPANCRILASSDSASGVAEGILWPVRVGENYHIYVDNFSLTRGQAFTIEVAVAEASPSSSNSSIGSLRAVEKSFHDRQVTESKRPK